MLACLSLFCLTTACVELEHPVVTGRVEQHRLASAIVGDTYLLFVRVPPVYDEESVNRYPVVFQLDANFIAAYDINLDEFNVTAGYASHYESRNRIPATIVVGIGYPYDDEPGKGRNRDYTLPGASSFYLFIRDELLPFIEARYRIAGPQGRALFGHSYGGLFALYGFLQYQSTAPLFTGFVAASPSIWESGGDLYASEEEFAGRETVAPLMLFMTAGRLEGPVINVYFNDFTSRIAARGFTGLSFGTRRYRTDHIGTITRSFRDGLLFVFDRGLRGEP